MPKMNVRKGDEVIVISGKDKGKVGKVVKAYPTEDRVVVEGVAIAKRHTKPSQADPQGGIIEKPMPIHVSNVMHYDAKAKKGSRIGHRVENGKKVRYLRSNNETI